MIPEKGDDAKKDNHKDSSIFSSPNSSFLPWGVTAWGVLQSIVSGEIPTGYGADRFDFGDAIALQGGHIRCVVVDLRTSEETASAQRDAALKEQETKVLQALQDKVDLLGRQAAEAEAVNQKAAAELKEVESIHEKAKRDVAKAESTIEHFRTKYQKYLGPGKLLVFIFVSYSFLESQSLTQSVIPAT